MDNNASDNHCTDPDDLFVPDDLKYSRSRDWRKIKTLEDYELFSLTNCF